MSKLEEINLAVLTADCPMADGFAEGGKGKWSRIESADFEKRAWLISADTIHMNAEPFGSRMEFS